MIRRALIGLVTLLALVCAATAQTLDFPQLTGRVVDAAGIIDANARDDVGRRLATFEERSGTKIVVATIPSLQGADIDTYAMALADQWRLGRDGKNGAILLIAPNAGKVAIQAGENLRGRLTDDTILQVIKQTLVPRLAADDIAGGVRGGVDHMIAVLDDAQPRVAAALPGVSASTSPAQSPAAPSTQMAQADTGVTGSRLTFPALTGRVVDEANILDSTARAALEKISSDLEAKSTDQLVIVTLRSLRGTSIEDYGVQLGRAWQIGQKGKNNGVLLIVAPNERKVRIEVGYGLEGSLTDAITSFIIQNAILPRFKAGDFPGGAKRGAEDIVSVLSGDEEYKQRAMQSAKTQVPADDFFVMLMFVLIAGFIFLNVIFSIIVVIRSVLRQMGLIAPLKKGQKKSWWDEMSMGSSSGGGSSGSSWSSGSSSGGGFSGGGGSFGGGGSSGSW